HGTAGPTTYIGPAYRAVTLSARGDAFTADGAGDGDGADLGERSAAPDAEGVDDAVGARLDVEVAAVRGHRRVDRAGVGSRVAERGQRAAAVVAVAGEAGTAGVRRVETRAVTYDPARCGLPRRLPVDEGERPVGVDRERRDRVRGLGDDEMPTRVEGDRERDLPRVGIHDRL